MIVVIATIECRENSVNYIKTELKKLVPYTIKEKGCIHYSFYQDINKSNYFNSFEVWLSQEDIDNHLKSIHMQNYFYKTKNYITNFIIKEMRQI